MGAYERQFSQPVCQTCPGDVNGDATVDGADVAGFVSCLLSGPVVGPLCGCADMNGDQLVASGDLSLFVAKLLGDPVTGCP